MEFVLAIILAVCSIKSGSYLKTILIFYKNANKATGRIVAYEGSRSIMTKNALIPKVKYLTENNIELTAKPISSWFFELNHYKLNDTCTVFYDKKQNDKIIIKSNLEVFTNLIFIVVSLCIIAWIFIKTFA